MPLHTSLYPVSDIREIEQAAMAGLPAGTLMQRAGQAAAQAAIALLTVPIQEAKVLVLAGPGNNGGDALEAAHLLAGQGVQVSVLLHADHVHQSSDAQQAFARAKNGSVRFIPIDSPLNATSWDLVLDGLFGIGLSRAPSGALRALIETVNAFACPVLALDVPSGLNADTGNIVGPNGIAVEASHTITFIGNKPGLHTGQGRDYAGQVLVSDLGIDLSQFKMPHSSLNDATRFTPCLHPRRHGSHKGSYGDVIVIGGAAGMVGAPILAARAAAKCGAGRVFAAFVDTPPAYDSLQPELMFRAVHTVDFATAALVAGPGLGTSRAAHDVLSRAMTAHKGMVIDADALNLLASEPELQQKFMHSHGATVITPHPLEAARLLQISTTEIQADRLLSARRLARQFNTIAILKGSGTVIAKPDGEVVINTTGNPALATAGTGDVLAGICGALLAQSLPAWEAALVATWLHGKAADTLVNEGIGPIGVTASELIPCVRTLLNRFTKNPTSREAARFADYR